MAENVYTYPYPRPMVTVDALVFAARDDGWALLFVERKHEPFMGRWALPGGFVEMDETLDAAVARELYEETGVRGCRLEQLHSFGDPGRDPRGRSITVSYYALVDWRDHVLEAADDASDAAWFPLSALPPLAFDHSDIVEYAVKRLRQEGILS